MIRLAIDFVCVCFFCSDGNKRVLPLAFLDRREKNAKKKDKRIALVYNRDIVCLPNKYQEKSGIIKI